MDSELVVMSRREIERADGASDVRVRVGVQLLSCDPRASRVSRKAGRVERANKTLQDRLAKELRLRDISTMQDANAHLPLAPFTRTAA